MNTPPPVRQPAEPPRRILITGATGYIGGRLAPRLLETGYRVRCLVRDPQRLHGRPWIDRVECIRGDALQPDEIASAMQEVDTVFYLIHSMGGGPHFHARDLRAARNVADAARAAGVRHLIYLGALGDADAPLSEHLRSRQETGDCLRTAGVPVTEFRAGVIVGSGSLSFEMIRYLTERVPLMVCPRWVYTRTQPIAVRDVLAYLLAAIESPPDTHTTVEIGGEDVITYREMMLTYAAVRGLKRVMLPVPVLTPRLSSYWVDLVTPIPAAIARPLIRGLRNECIVRDDSAKRRFPSIQPVSYRIAVERALKALEASQVETAWSDALASSRRQHAPVVLTSQEGMIVESRQRRINAPPAAVFALITALGGTRGWLYMNWAWRLRGGIDRLAGGVGLRRGRRDATRLRVGDALDFWRVEALEPDRLLRLRAEMKLPGKAWLQFELLPDPDAPTGTLLNQCAIFAPRGLFGLVYWYALYPLHQLIFNGMIDAIVRQAGSPAPTTD